MLSPKLSSIECTNINYSKNKSLEMGPIINPSVSKIMHPLGVVNFFQKMLSTSTMNAKLPNFGTSY